MPNWVGSVHFVVILTTLINIIKKVIYYNKIN